MRDLASDVTATETAAVEAAAVPTRGASLEQQLYRGWGSIAFGIMLAGGAYPVIFASVVLSLEVISGAEAPDVTEFLAIAFMYSVAGAVIGFLWAGLVLAIVLPIVHLVVWSLKPRGDLIWFGAFCGGLVGFVAVMPFIYVIMADLGPGGVPDSWLVVNALALGPALTTVLGQLGGAWGGKRAVNWCRTYVREVAAARVHETSNGTAVDMKVADDSTPPVNSRLQFGIRHLLWLAVWVSILLSIIRLSGIPFGLALPLLVGWVAFQTATLWIGGLMLPRARAWWAASGKVNPERRLS